MVPVHRYQVLGRALLLLVATCAGCHTRGGWGSKHDPSEAASPVTTVFAWDPPGLVVTAELAAYPEPATGEISLPVRRVSLPNGGARLRDGLNGASGLERLGSLAESAQLRVAVIRRHGSSEDLIPLPLALRHRPGDLPLADGDLIGLVDWRLVGVEWHADPASEAEPAPPSWIGLGGLLENPGRYALNDPHLHGLVGDPELPGGEFLKQPSGVPLAELLVVHRTIGTRVQRIYLPNELAATVYPLESEAFWDRFSQFRLRDGDFVVATSLR